MKNSNKIHSVWLRITLLIILGLQLGFAAPPRKTRRPGVGPLAQLKGSPSNKVEPAVPPRPGSIQALPIPPIPPYEPVEMTARIGTTGLVTYNNTNGVAMIDPRTHTISPVLLNEFDWTIDPETDEPYGGPLGSEGGGRFDLAMTPDGRQALISNFGDGKVFIVDLSSGMPVVAGTVDIGFFAEDIDIDPSGRWALVSDGGFSPVIATIDIAARSLAHTFTLPDVEITDPEDPWYPGYARSANAVDIAADGRTVVVADYFMGFLNVLLLDPATGALTFSQSTEQLWKYGTDENAAFPFLYRPVNVTISPDGRTVVGINCVRSTSDPEDADPNAFFEGSNLPIFLIDAPGHLVRQPDLILPFRVNGAQSLVFSADGRRAYLHAIYYDDEPEVYDPDEYWMYSEIEVLAVNRPGQLSLVGSVRLPTQRGTSQLFGVDCLAITPDGGFLYVTHPTVSGATPVIDVVDLRTLTLAKQIGTPTWYPDPMRNWPDPPNPPDPGNSSDWIEWVLPVGIAFPPIPANRRPVAVIGVDKPEVFLDDSETATFDGSGSHDPDNDPLHYRWSLVSVPSGSQAGLVSGDATAVLTPDVPGLFQVGLVVNDGTLDSAMVTASVRAKFYPVLPPVGAALQRLENDFIFYKEYVNRLTWAANPGNKAAIAAVKIYRKPKGAGDGAYALLVSLPGTAASHDDKGLAADQQFTYRITAVSSRGVESDPTVVGN